MRKTLFLSSAVVGICFLSASCGLKLGPANSHDLQGEHDTSLMPLAVGRSWRYQVQQVGNGSNLTTSPCANGVKFETVVASSTLAGRTDFEVVPLCGSGPDVFYSFSGDEVDQYSLSRWQTYLGVPVQTGQYWHTADGSEYAWEGVPSISTQAGTFLNCWRRTQTYPTGYGSFDVYCNGVGKVVSHFEDPNQNGWDAQLMLKAF